MKKVLKVVLIALAAALVLSVGYVGVSFARGRGIQDVRIRQDLHGKKVTVAIDYNACSYFSVEYLHTREDYDGSMGAYCVLIKMSDVFGHVNDSVYDKYPTEIRDLKGNADIKVRVGAPWMDVETFGICIGSDKPLSVEEESEKLAPFGTVRVSIGVDQ